MNYGPLIFLGVFFALSSSWYGLIFWPQFKLGRMEPVKLESNGQTYPFRGGLAAQGAEIYRKNGCYHCHSQQVSQTGLKFSLIMLSGGTNRTAMVPAVMRLNPKFTQEQAERNVAQAAEKYPVYLMNGLPFEDVDKARGELVKIGGKSVKLAIDMESTGPEMNADWGARRSVAQDFVSDNPVMLGAIRHGPDLANVGDRYRKPIIFYSHIYSPASFGTDPPSTMPPFPYLFEVRKIGRAPAPEHLILGGGYGAPAGYEIVPKPEAEALAAYLASLKRDVALPEAPATSPEREVARNGGGGDGGGGGGGGGTGGGGGKGKKKQ